LQQLGLKSRLAQLAVNGVGQDDGRFLARVVAALENGEILQVGVWQPQAGQDRRAHRTLGMVQGQTQLGDSQHIDTVIWRRRRLQAQPRRTACQPRRKPG